MPKRGTVVVITGASSGIGRATALRLARGGASLVLASRRGRALTELSEECAALGGRALAVPADTADADAVDALAAAAVAHYGRIDAWVNNAAVSVYAPFTETPLEDFRRVIDVGLMGYVHGCRSALKVMQRQGHGSIVNVSSILGEVPQPYTAAYGMAKAAVRALGVSLRGELALQKARRIHVSTVLPPTIDTPFFRHSANYTGHKVVAMPPVYEADAVAATILKAIDHPRNEVVVGRIGRALVRRHRRSPAAVEAQLAVQTEKAQFARDHRTPWQPGTLHTPNNAPSDATVSGGWRGAERHGRRKTLATLLALVGAAFLASRVLRR